MIPGYMGKILWVDLTTGKITVEEPEDKLYKDYVGGYGIGAKVLYDHMKPKADPLGPDNILGLISGPLTGTQIPTGARYTAVAKSPLTGGWGDANSGGSFGPYLKFSGFDAVFFTGISPKPVYLLIDEGKAEIKDAAALWGKDSYETEETLEAEYGKTARVCCIGQAGEKRSLIAAIMTDKGSAAGRSGLGAVMGSKKLKAVVARGTMPVAVADKDLVLKLRKEHVQGMNAPGPMSGPSLHRFGTSAMTAGSAHSGDTPIKNWGGIGVKDLPDIEGLKAETLETYVSKLSGCWHCPIACKAVLKEGTGEYKYAAGIRRPEYETQGTFGGMCLVSNTDAINMANDICNRYGMDTIAAGTVVAFAIELYENGIITKKDTGGLELGWGNHKTMVAMAEKVGKREDIGALLADGVKAAAGKIGKGAEKYAVHVGGVEVGMHDPKMALFGNSAFARYQMDATPGRHTQSFGPGSFQSHMVNATGICMIGFGFGGGPEKVAAWLNAVTGLGFTGESVAKCGEKMAVIRHLFNLREGISELKWYAHPRVYGDPPQAEGPLAGVKLNTAAQNYWNLGALDWDMESTKPSKKKLVELGFPKLAEEMWPPMAFPGAPPPPPGKPEDQKYLKLE
jgi:aldehyde:ferredoxin oxidoreductase